MRDKRDFFQRLLWVLGDRKLYAWGMPMGFSSATLARLKRGTAPKGETLAMIARAENCSVSWLLTGQGAPFLVNPCDTDAEMESRLRAYLDDEDWRVDLLHDTRVAVVVLTLVAEFGEKEDAVQYTAMELLSGPVGPISAETLRPRVQRAVRVDPDQMRAVREGKVGTYRVLQWIGLSGEDHGGQKLAELAAQYGGGAYAPDEQAFVEKYRLLSPADRTRAQAVIDALVDTGADAEGVTG